MSEEYGKPLKLGFLFILAPGKLKRVFKYRFCILTTLRELDWYKKQEVRTGVFVATLCSFVWFGAHVSVQDCQEHKRGGVIRGLEECEIEEVEDQLGQPFCFQIRIGGKATVLAAESHQDRVNWIVEILKFRGIQGLISLLDHADLSKHAAFALANLAGRTSGP